MIFCKNVKSKCTYPIVYVGFTYVSMISTKYKKILEIG
jgi:hypothetical protein